MSIYHYLFSKYMVVEVSQVSDDQKQALANAIKYVCNPTLAYQRRHPSVGLPCKEIVGNSFAAAKVRKKYGLGKFWGGKLSRKLILQGK